MLKKLALLAVVFLGFTGVSYAQGHGHGGGHGGGSHGGGGRGGSEHHGPATFHPGGHGVRRGSDSRGFRGDGGRHTADRDRYHYDGRHFDHQWHDRFFGRGHRFWVGRPVFYGGYWRFWYGGYWFYWYDAWPSDWCYCDQVYIDYDDAADCYFMYNPVRPGFRLRIGVVF